MIKAASLILGLLATSAVARKGPTKPSKPSKPAKGGGGGLTWPWPFENLIPDASAQYIWHSDAGNTPAVDADFFKFRKFVANPTSAAREAVVSFIIDDTGSVNVYYRNGTVRSSPVYSDFILHTYTFSIPAEGVVVEVAAKNTDGPGKMRFAVSTGPQILAKSDDSWRFSDNSAAEAPEDSVWEDEEIPTSWGSPVFVHPYPFPDVFAMRLWDAPNAYLANTSTGVYLRFRKYIRNTYGVEVPVKIYVEADDNATYTLYNQAGAMVFSPLACKWNEGTCETETTLPASGAVMEMRAYNSYGPAYVRAAVIIEGSGSAADVVIGRTDLGWRVFPDNSPLNPADYTWTTCKGKICKL